MVNAVLLLALCANGGAGAAVAARRLHRAALVEADSIHVRAYDGVGGLRQR